MSEKFSSLVATRAKSTGESKRKGAVVAALELIAVSVANPSNKSSLSYEINKLSEYADTIQAALSKSNPDDNEPD